MLTAPNLLKFDWLMHGFGERDSVLPEGITTLRQVHSATVLEAGAPGGDRFAEGDALVTRQLDMIIGVRTADCVPVLLADSRTRAVAAIHAGWRGTVGDIAGTAVREMVTRYGSRVEDLHAAVGPSIGPCCYEVGAEVARQFGNSAAPANIDLPGVNETQLRAVGVTDVWVARECTFCDADKYFSFRREKENAGRMMSFIGRRE